MKTLFLLVAVAVSGLALDAHAADNVRIKLATLAPTGSTYHKSLLTMREAWKKASGGTVELMIYPDGKLGGEADTVGLMKGNSLQASLLTTIGLAEIEKAVTGLQSIPMGFHDLAEVDYVGEKLHGMLEERLAAKGFVVLFWTDTGWVRFFGKKAFTTPEDLKKMKLFVWAGNADQVEIYRTAGLNPVPLETADILPGLQTGLIEATPAPPVFALATQLDTRAPYMLELNWGPLVGACVVRKQTWEKIPESIRTELLKSAVAAGLEIKASARKESEDSVAAMVEKRGLKVTKVTPEVEAAWRTAAEAAYPKIRGTIVPEDIFDKAMSLIREYRARQAAPGKQP